MTTKRRYKQLKPDSSSAGQSGGDQGIPRDATVDSASVEELLEEGNSFDAGVVFGLENSKLCPRLEERVGVTQAHLGTPVCLLAETLAHMITAVRFDPPPATVHSRNCRGLYHFVDPVEFAF